MYDPYAEEERRQRRDKVRLWRSVSRIGNFYGWLIGIVVVFALLALLTTLYSWLKGDLPQVIDSLREPIMNVFG